MFKSTAKNNVVQKSAAQKETFEVTTFSESGNSIKTHAGIVIKPDFSLDNAPEFDILIVPGGPLRAVNKVLKNRKIIEYIVMSKNIEMICSVCSGSLILAEAGLLNGKTATTHHLALSILKNKWPRIQVENNKKVVKDGNIITSGGVSSGINMALYLVEKLFNNEIAKRTAKVIEFDSYTDGDTMEK
ncbi:DJ-1/PfpI family protein [Paenibacillus caui]|uniref:DJ-1/PfpI family protein n=1 Tax=Paenibacillus caui TaxID=2873927 RepID=UPI001CAA0A5A